MMIPVNDPMVNTVILEVRRFYDEVYSPGGKAMPTPSQVQSFVAGSTIPQERKPGLTSVIDYWFTEPVGPNDPRVEPEANRDRPFAPVQGDVGSGGGSSDNGRIWGPPFAGLGVGRDFGGGIAGGGGGYPVILGPTPNRATLGRNYGGTLPTSGGAGSDILSKYLPFSRQPGDMDLVPDPYRVSQSYSPSSYSSRNEPVPFLTDFSAFLN